MTAEPENIRIPDGYEVIACLKDGKSEKTYLAYDQKHRRKAVLKISQDERVKTEAELISSISGEGIPKIYDFYKTDGFCLAREYIEGEPLEDYVQKCGTLPDSEVIEIGIQLCRILELLHSCNPPIIHRDIKTDNIIRTPDGRLFLIDFGISRVFDPTAGRDTSIMGTPAYAPPEQFGYRQTDERSDIYSLGCLMHELAAGERELTEGTVGKRLDPIIKKCTCFSPDGRYQSAAALKKRLLSETTRKQSKRSAAAVVAAALAAAAIIVFICSRDYSSAGNELIGEGYENASDERISAISSSDVFSFKDSEIEAAVRSVLNKPQGEITRGELDKITELYLLGEERGGEWEQILTHGTSLTLGGREITSRGDVSTLEDISFMPNLHTLALCGQNISDLSPLAGSKIKRLALHGNNIADISPLAECSELCELIISDNPVSDFSPLTECAQLSRLVAGATFIENLDEIARIPFLYRLDLFDCGKMRDYSKLREMEFLEELIIKPVTEHTLDIIARMDRLEYLYIWDSPDLTELSQLSRLTRLKILWVDLCPVSSVEGVDSFSELTSLNLRNTPATDLSALAECGSLETISVNGTKPESWDFLADMDGLVSVRCDESQRAQITAALGENSRVEIIETE